MMFTACPKDEVEKSYETVCSGEMHLCCPLLLRASSAIRKGL